MFIGVNTLNRILLARLATPPVPIRDEEELLLGEMVQTRKILVRLLVSTSLPRLVGRRQATRIGNVLAKRQAPVDVERLAILSVHGEVGVLLDEALGSVFKSLDRLLRPPVRVVARLVVVSTGGVEGVTELMAGYGTECTVRHVCGHVHIEDWELHDTRGEDDLVAWWVVIGIDRGRSHAPLLSVHRLAERRPLVAHAEPAHRKCVCEKCVRLDVEVFVVRLQLGGIHDVRAAGGVPDLLDDAVNFFDGELGCGLVHPLGGFELLDELGLDVGDDVVAEFLGVGGEGFLDEEAAQEPA